MAAKKVSTLIKEARTQADMTQEQLARKIKGHKYLLRHLH